MLIEFLASIGPWNWIILGCILLALEIVVPGFYLLWIGIAAVLTGTLSLQLADVAIWTWQAQIVFFLVLSIIIFSSYLGIKKVIKIDPFSIFRG